MKIRYIIILLILIINGQNSFAHYNMNTPVEGKSIANNALQFNVLKKMYQDFAPKHPTCYDYKVVDTQILHFPYDVKKKNNKYVKGYWKELWTLQYCDSRIQIPVTFYINKNSTQFIIDIKEK